MNDILFTATQTSAHLPHGDIEFTLKNETAADFHCNFYDWRLAKHVDGGLKHLLPITVPLPEMTLQPSEHHTWTLRFDNTNGQYVRDASDTPSMDQIDIAGLGPGDYQFSIRGQVDGRDEHTYAVTFTLEGDSITLPSGEPTSSRMDTDDTLVISPNGTEHEGQCIVMKDRDNTAPMVPELLIEQVMQIAPLRQSLVSLRTEPSVQKVLYRGETAILPHTRHAFQLYDVPEENGQWTFRYRGEVFTVKLRE